MDKIDTFKALLPFIPAGYRRPLLFFIHLEEIMNIMKSLRSCLNAPLSAFGDDTVKDTSELINTLMGNMSPQDADMLNMFSMMKNFSDLKNMTSATPDLNSFMGQSAGMTDGENDFSEELDDLFKDFLDETNRSDDDE